MNEKKRLTMTGLVKNITKESIYKIMNTITLAVSALFLVKNIIGGEMTGALAIGVVLGIYCTVLVIMGKTKIKADTKHLVVSIALLVVISIVSIFSGSSFSDDFILYLSAISS